MDTAPALPKVFISYSHQDEAWKDRLVKQLQVLQLEGDLEVWDDSQIDAGDDWQPEIEAAMASARVAVLLISADFLTSGFILGTEVPEILRRRESKGLRVIPVIVHPCPWQAVEWLAKIQSRPKDGKELASFTKVKANKHLSALALEIRDLLREGAPSPAPRGRDGEGAPLHNLPYPPLNNLFTGRQEELDALTGDGTAAITQSTALSGLGGIGKTRLAVEYAWRSGNRYTAVWFVRADSPENLRRNLAALAGPELMNLPEWEEQIEEKTVAAVKRWLREHPGWLMVLDNIDTPEAADAVLEVLPSLYIGRVLITSRLTSWPATVRKQELYKLSCEEAVRFLLQRTEEGRAKAADDDRQALALAEALDGLPLALEQAAAFILRRRMGLADYLQAWEQERSEVLKWHDPRVMEYPASVAVTWQQTFHRLSSTSAALLRLMAFLASDPIPIDMFEQGAKHVKQAAQRLCKEVRKKRDGLSVQAALDELAEYSMISRQDGGMVAVHRMVQEVLRSQIPEERRRDWIEGALQVVDKAAARDPEDVRTWPDWDRLRAHVAEVVKRADEVGIVKPTIRLMIELGLLLWAKGRSFEAEPLVRRALNIAEASFGPNHTNVATILTTLALLLKDTNRLGEAEPLIRRALAIDEASFGKVHTNVATNLNNLALLLQGTNRLKEAESLMRRALAIDEASLGKGHPRVATELDNLALLLHAMNRLGEAEPLMRRAVAIDEASFGNNHPDVAIRLNNLTLLLQDTNRPKEAEPLMRRALEIFEGSLGPEHPRTQAARKNLATLLAKIAATVPSGDDNLTAPEAPLKRPARRRRSQGSRLKR